MNRAQQEGLISTQEARIRDCEAWKRLPSDSRFALQLDMEGRNGSRYHVKLDLDDFDILPPKLHILDEGGEITWDIDKVPPQPFLNPIVHPRTGRIFFCVKGTYEYHNHPLHEHQAWDALRNSWDLARIVAEISAALTAEPSPALPPHVELNIRIPPSRKHVRTVKLFFRHGRDIAGVTAVYADGSTRKLGGVGPDDASDT